MGEEIHDDIFTNCRSRADRVIDTMRGVAKQVFENRTDIIIGVNGSVARREYTSGSDVDYFILSNEVQQTEARDDQKKFRQALEAKGLKMPSSGGVFEKTLATEKLKGPIGGDQDSNQTLTRRMLFILEGEWIFNQDSFDVLRKEIICKYVSDELENGKIALYLLNDIIRYWRTICVDYEYKTAGGSKSKPLRLAKLRISRMLLCFAGMIAIAEAIDMPVNEKRERLVGLFSMQALPRMESILGCAFSEARSEYSDFLMKMDNECFRAALDKKGDDSLRSREFLEITETARKFKEALLRIILENYGLTCSPRMYPF